MLCWSRNESASPPNRRFRSARQPRLALKTARRVATGSCAPSPQRYPACAAPGLEKPLTDTELVAKTLAGDMHALKTLMQLHHRALYRTARAILRDDAEAEDAVQEAYLQAFRALATFRGDSKL